MKTAEDFLDEIEGERFLGGYNKPCIAFEKEIILKALKEWGNMKIDCVLSLDLTEKLWNPDKYIKTLKDKI